MRLLAGIFFSCMLATAAEANCEDILKYINYEKTKRSDGTTTEALTTSQLCEASFESANESQRAQIEASYKSIFSAKASASSDEIMQAQKQKCDNKFGLDYRESHGISEDLRVSPLIPEILRACYSQHTFKVSGVGASGNLISADFLWDGKGSILVGSPQFDSEDLTCHTIYNGAAAIFPLTLGSNELLTVACKRNEQNVDLGSGETVSIYRETMLTVPSNFQSVVMPLPEVTKVALPNSRLRLIEEKLDALIARADKSDAQLTSLSREQRKQATRVDTLEGKKYVTTMNDVGGTHHRQQVLAIGGNGGSRLLESTLTCPPGAAVWGIGFGAGNQDAWLLCALPRTDPQ